MDESEKKKWVIERIDNVFATYEQFLKNYNDEFHKFVNNEANRLSQLKKASLSGIAFAISLLVASKGAGLDTTLFLQFLAITIFIGGFVLIVAVIFENRVKKILDGIENSGIISRQGIYYVEGFFEYNTMMIDEYSSDDYVMMINYFIFCIAPSFKMAIFYAIQKSLKFYNSFFLSEPTLKYLKKLRSDYKNSLDEAVHNYEKERQIYESNSFLQPLMKYGQSLLDYKVGKQTIPDYPQLISNKS